jgi:hypothetical protein
MAPKERSYNVVPIPNITVMMPAPQVRAAAILAGDPKNEYDHPGSGRPGSKRSQEICWGLQARLECAADHGVIPHEVVPSRDMLKDTGQDVYGAFEVYAYQGPDGGEEDTIADEHSWPTGRTVGGTDLDTSEQHDRTRPRRAYLRRSDF